VTEASPAPVVEPELWELERELGLRGSFYWFVKWAWHLVEADPFVDGWHIKLICDVLERVQRRELRKVVIEIPPGCMKSMLVNVFWPAWCWIRDPSDSFLNTSFDHKLTRRDAGKTLQIVRSEEFRQRWGDRCYIPDDAGATEHKSVQGGWRFTTSTGGKATGNHPKRKTIDDPTKPKNVTPQALQDAIDYWRNTLVSRGAPDVVTTVCIMQRLAVNDMAGYFEAQGGWHIVRLPMRYEVKDAYPDDPRTTDGELLWPERHSEAAVAELEREMMSRVAAAQLQQRPFPEGGNIIKREWIQWYDPTPDRRHPELVQLPESLHSEMQSWDFAFKDTNTSCKVAGYAGGMHMGNLYLTDGDCDRKDFVESIAAVKAMRIRRPTAEYMLFEPKANGPAIKNSLEKEGVTGIVEVEPDGGKVARVYAAQPFVEGKHLFLPFGIPWALALVESLVAFPTGPWDDDVDAVTQLINYQRTRAVDYDAAAEAAEKAGLW